MAGQDPSQQTSLVVLLGASEWPLSSSEFISSPAFLNSAHSLEEYFLNPQQFGLPKNNLLNLFDSDQSADDIDISISNFLERRVKEMKDNGSAAQDLLVSYIGHGAFAGQDSEFCLTIRRTRSKNLRASSISMRSLADTLKEAARNLRRILILDCCFAASAFHAFQSAPGEVARQQTIELLEAKARGVGFPSKGTTLLCSSGPKIASLISKDNNYTMFTQALLQTLSQGNMHSQGYLSLRNVAELTADILREMPGGDAPRPYLNSPDQSEGDIAEIPFFPNLWVEKERQRAEAEQARLAEEERIRRAEEAEQAGERKKERRRRFPNPAKEATSVSRNRVSRPPPELLHPGPLWSIDEDILPLGTEQLRSRESLYAVGNGYFGTRGTFEEGHSGASPGTLLFGVFDMTPLGKEELANVPDWLPINLFANGERFHSEVGKILEYYRTLDMKHGVLNRIIRWESPKGIRLRIQCERFASLVDEHFGAIRYSVTVEELPSAMSSLDLILQATFDTAVGNYNVMHWHTINQGYDNDLVWLQSETIKSGVQLTQTMSFSTNSLQLDREVGSKNIQLRGRLIVGETVTAEKLVCIYTTHDNVVDHYQMAKEAHLAILRGSNENATLVQSDAKVSPYETLFSRHIATWQDYWDVSDVVIEGNIKAQLAIRYNIYQLRISISLHDSRYSVAPRGLTGFSRQGHISYDTEIFMLPFFTYVLPDLARNLLMYRYHLLPAARKKAASNGYDGAQYPWESTLNGEETTPSSIIHPETGEVIPVLNGFIELHISASVAHAVQQYWEISGDDDFMRDYGAEIVLSTATFWGSRAEKNEGHVEYEITNVIGPDEWHEHVNNNAFTNYMARDNILNALKDLHWLQTTAPAKARELVQQLNLNSERLERWQDITEHIRIPQDPKTKVYEQFDGFFKLDQLDQSQFAGRKDSFEVILGIHAVQKYQIIKQADVLMLLTVLAQQFDLETRRANWDYYYPLTDHDYGSSLSPAFHVQLACELGLSEASYKQFLLGALVDLENLRGNTPEGIHTTCAGAVWQAAIFGFAGLRVTEEGYTTSPSWPDGWTRLAFKFKHKGHLIEVDLHK